MRKWNGNCQRCGRPSACHIMSMYSTALICMDCKDAEEGRDDYDDARSAEESAVRSGDRNFPGVGEPS